MFSRQSKTAPEPSWNPKALVVDDDSFVLATIVAKLKRMNIDCVTGQTVASALARVNAEKFDLAIIDLGLPDGNGDEIMTAIRASKLNADTPIVIVTADTNDRILIDSIKRGKAMYVSQKPINWPCFEYLLEGTILNS